MYIAKLMKHIWEEEPISGIGRGYEGTFAIFFYGCNMRCVYCQNSKISRVRISEISNLNKSDSDFSYESNHIDYTPDELSNEILKAESSNVASISFITGVLYVDEIVDTIKIIKDKGLKLPIVYNSSGYESVSQIKKLDGLIDIYLPDFKYFDNELGRRLSLVPNYVDIAKKCIDEMYHQIESKRINEKYNDDKLPLLIVRHLVLPGHTEDSKFVIKYLHETYGDDVTLSIMSQYTPMPKNTGMEAFPELNRKLTKREYEKVVDYALKIGVKNAFIQDGDVAKESFIPEF